MRHLIFHLTPMAAPAESACWKWHLRQINHYARLFDGQLIFAVVSGPDMSPVEQVTPFLPARSQVISVPDTELRISYTLPLLLARVYSVDPQDTVFFAHTHGITWVGKKFEDTKRWWSLAMYRFLLAPQAMDALKQFPVVGWCKYVGPVRTFPPSSQWHYPGRSGGSGPRMCF